MFTDSDPVDFQEIPSTDKTHYVTGYLALPHIPLIDHDAAVRWAHHLLQQEDGETPAQELHIVEHPMKDHIHRREQARQKRAESECKEAMKGDIDWVRSGGTLRDRVTGKRDFERTNIIRKELELQELERKALNEWDVYESRWNALLASNGPLTFSAIPWPVADLPSYVGELTIRSIAHFVTAPLRVRSSNVARRHRIRQLILRYHPDKIYSIVSRTTDEEKVAVEEGVRVVLTCLKYLHDEEKALEQLA